MLAKVIIENGVKKIQALTADTGTGAPVGSYLYLEKKSNPQGYLYCDGSTFDETVYPALYQYLGTNVLPDWREFSAVGAEQNTTNVYDAQTNPNGVIHDHDVFTQGQAKDDQLQDHKHDIYIAGVKFDQAPNSTASVGSGLRAFNNAGTGNNVQAVNVTLGRHGTVTRGKSRAVFIYIKATSGLTENQQENVLNTINENNSYSTEEHPTGKKWIDGKPIYRKVLPPTPQAINAGSWSFGGLSSDIFSDVAQMIDVYGITEIGTNTEHTLNCQVGKNLGFYGLTTMNAGIIFIVEYTKTTD